MASLQFTHIAQSAQKSTPNIKVICAWCGRHIKGDPPAVVISHGICDECLAKIEQEQAEVRNAR